MRKILMFTITFILALTLSSCISYYNYDETKINITTTTNILADLANNIGKDRVNVYSLMGPGVDPHQYIARPHDYNALNKADFILVNGLFLEGKLASIFDSYKNKKTVLLVGDEILNNSSPELVGRLISDESFGTNYDPHFWFDIELYKEAARYLTNSLIKIEPNNKDYFLNNYESYLLELDLLDTYITNALEVIPVDKRYLISAHDAFEYFGRNYGFEVYALQGLSTEDQVSPFDVREIVDLIINKDISAIFPENSVPNETIMSVSEQVIKQGKKVNIGHNLHSDSLGDNINDNTYIKMYQQNVSYIIEAFTRKELKR